MVAIRPGVNTLLSGTGGSWHLQAFESAGSAGTHRGETCSRPLGLCRWFLRSIKLFWLMDGAANPRQAQGQNGSLWESEEPVQLRSRGTRTLPLASSAMAAQGRRCLGSGFPSGLPAPFPDPVPAELWGSGFLGVGWGIWQCDLSVPCVTPAGDGAWCASTCPCSCIPRHRDVAAEASGPGDVHPPAPTAAA